MVELKTQFEKVSSIKGRIQIEVPVERVKEALETTFKKVQKKAKLKGFREGKVPEHLVWQYYGAQIQKETMESLIGTTYPEALAKESQTPVSYPQIDIGSFNKDAPFTYAATFDVKPEVKVTGYDSLKLTRFEIKVTEEEVESRLKYLQRSMTQLEPVEDNESLRDGFVAVIDFVGTADGKKFKGSEAKDFVVDFGSGSLLPAFEEKMKGMKKGENRKIEFDYPADYFNKELAGKRGRFSVTLKDIRKKLIPELDDEFAKELGNFKTLEDVKRDIREKIVAAKEKEVRLDLYNQALEQLVNAHPFEVPESMVLDELNAMLNRLAKQFEREGKTLEQMGIKVEEFVNRYKDEATKRVRGYLILDAIADIENIQVSQQEIDNRFEELAARYNQNISTVRRFYEEKGLIDALKTQILHEKTLDFVVSRSKIKVERPKKEKKRQKIGV